MYGPVADASIVRVIPVPEGVTCAAVNPKSRQASYSIAVMDKLKTVALLYAIICIIQQLAENVGVPYSDCKQWFMNVDGMHLPRIEFSAKQAAIMIIITILVTAMGTAHGATHAHPSANNTIRSCGRAMLHRFRMLYYHHQQTIHTSEHTTSLPPVHDQRISGELADQISSGFATPSARIWRSAHSTGNSRCVLSTIKCLQSHIVLAIRGCRI